MMALSALVWAFTALISALIPSLVAKSACKAVGPGLLQAD